MLLFKSIVNPHATMIMIIGYDQEGLLYVAIRETIQGYPTWFLPFRNTFSQINVHGFSYLHTVISCQCTKNNYCVYNNQ